MNQLHLCEIAGTISFMHHSVIILCIFKDPSMALKEKILHKKKQKTKNQKQTNKQINKLFCDNLRIKFSCWYFFCEPYFLCASLDAIPSAVMIRLRIRAVSLWEFRNFILAGVSFLKVWRGADIFPCLCIIGIATNDLHAFSLLIHSQWCDAEWPV